MCILKSARFFRFWWFGLFFLFREWKSNEKDQPEVTHPESCIKIQTGQNVGTAAKNHNGVGNFRNSICQNKHHIFTELRANMGCEDLELSTCAWLGARGTRTPFSKGGIPHYCAFPPQLRVETSHWNLLYVLGK